MTGWTELQQADDTGLTETEEIAAELHALQRGSGLRRPELSRALGPKLRHHLGLATDVSDERTRQAIAEALYQVAQVLPREERLVFLVALGIEDDGRLLRHRLQAAAVKLRLSLRSIERRLDDADLRVAALLSSGPSPLLNGETVDRGIWNGRSEAWRSVWEQYYLDLSMKTPELVISKKIRALVDLSEITETVSIPQTGGVLNIHSATTSATVKAFKRLSPSSLEFTLALPTLRAGQLHGFSVHFSASATAQLGPYLVTIPVEPAPEFFIARVQFHPSRLPGELRRVQDLPPLALLDEPTGSPAQVDAKGRAEARFRGLSSGLAYGLKWSWPGIRLPA